MIEEATTPPGGGQDRDRCQCPDPTAMHWDDSDDAANTGTQQAEAFYLVYLDSISVA